MKSTTVRMYACEEIAGTRHESSGFSCRMMAIGKLSATAVVLCMGLSVASPVKGQVIPHQALQTSEKAHAQVCPDPPPQTSGSHIFRRLGETFDIPITIADCQPVSLTLHWSNGRNNGSLLNVTFLDSNNQPVYSRGVSVYRQGVLELPLASLGAQPWFAAPSVISVPATVVIQAVQPFASPAGISYTVTRKAARVRSKPRAPVQPVTLSSGQPSVSLETPSNLAVLDDQLAMTLRTAEGRVLLQGQSSWASGNGGLVRYKLKQIALPAPRQIVVHGRARTIESAYRLTLAASEAPASHGGPKQVPPLSKFSLVWIDDIAIPAFSLDSEEISALIFDRSVLRDGAQLAVSNSDGGSLYSMTEPLKYQPASTAPASSIASGESGASSGVESDTAAEEGNRVVSVRGAVRVIGATRIPLIQIELKTDRPFPSRDRALQLQVGRRFFLNELTGDHTGRTLTLTLTQEMFAELRDGADIVAFFDKPDRSGFAGRDVWYFGRIDKSMTK
jgi:hypothetical protein